MSSSLLPLTHRQFYPWNPLYHTLYETFAHVDENLDQGFYFHAATVAVWALLTVELADAQVGEWENVYLGVVNRQMEEMSVTMQKASKWGKGVSSSMQASGENGCHKAVNRQVGEWVSRNSK